MRYTRKRIEGSNPPLSARFLQVIHHKEFCKNRFENNKNTKNKKIMKKLLLVAIMAVAGVAAAVAQPRAIGANIGYGIDVSYQHALGEANMIDLSVNIPCFSGIGATATYDWVNPFGTSIPWNNKGEWNWNLGVGAGLDIWKFQAIVRYNWNFGVLGSLKDFTGINVGDLKSEHETFGGVSVHLAYFF